MNRNNNELFNKYLLPELEFIRHVCWKYCNDKKHFDEHYNEVLTILFLHIHTYNPERPMRAWLYTVVRREILRIMLRRTRECDYISFVDPVQFYNIHIIQEEDPKPDYIQLMYKAISRLDPVGRDVMLMRLNGLKLSDIASQLYQSGRIQSDSIEAIRYKSRHSLNQLRAMLVGNRIMLKEKQLAKRDNLNFEIMAKLKSEIEKWASIPDKEYLKLLEDHIMMTALKAAGIEELPIYKVAETILKDNRIEIHLKPIKHFYK